MRTFLVTGATGNVGGACARYILGKGDKVRVLLRDTTSDKAKALADAGATLVQGDFSDHASLISALEGVDAALLACSNQQSQVELETSFISAAAASKLKYLVKLSTCGCPGYCEVDSAIEYGRYHAVIEATLAGTAGLAWTVLQPTPFMQNHLGDIFGTLPHKLLAYPRTAAQLESGAARIVDTRDVGDIAAKLLLLEEQDRRAHVGCKYHVCGPASWSVRRLAELYEEALKLSSGAITCVEGLSEADYADNLEKNAGFPRWLAVAVARNQIFWAESRLDYASSEPVLALHQEFRTMEAWVQEHAPLVKLGADP